MKKEIENTELIPVEMKKMEVVQEQVENKRLELQEKLKRPVYSYIVDMEDDDYAICFIQEPQRLTKMRIIDMLAQSQGVTAAGQTLFESSVIREESDQRIFSQDCKYDALYLTIITNCVDLISVYSDVLKKK